ncbi:MAG: PHB depolymerase family esterase [Actinomycetota bacterium]
MTTLPVGPPTPTDTPAPFDGANPAAPGAWTPTLDAGRLTLADGTVRDYLYLAPDPAVTDPVPLVLVFHGGGGTSTIIANPLGFDELTAPLPALVVFPQGTDLPGPSLDGVWNFGHSYLGGQVGADDVAFVDELLIELAGRSATAGWRIDQSRTYACGFSAGGMMSYRLAAERSREFAAVAVICSSIGGVADTTTAPDVVHLNDPAINGGEPVSILHLHGLLDEGVPFHGGREPTDRNPRSDVPTMDAMGLWVANNGCDPVPSVTSTPHGTLRTWSGGRGDSEVQLLLMPGRGHGVPDFALDRILRFFDDHPAR